MHRFLKSLMLAPAVLLGFTGSAHAQFDDASWFTIDCGGTISTQGDFEVQGTIGQTDAASLSGGDFSLDGGFWGNIDEPVCGSSDFDGDGDYGTDADIEAFFACLGGNCCAPCFPGGADFNGDGDTGTDADIESFFRVLGGGNC